MKQISLATTEFELVTKRTRKREFLDEMNLIIPWSQLLGLIAPHAPTGKTGRPPFATEVMLAFICCSSSLGIPTRPWKRPCMTSRCTVSLPSCMRVSTDCPTRAPSCALDTCSKKRLGAQILAAVNAKLVDRGLMLKTGTVVDATLIAAPSSTKNDKGEREPEMHQTKKGNQWHFGMKAHIGVDADSGLVHTVTTTPANAHDVTKKHALLHGQKEVVFADSGYRGFENAKRFKTNTLVWTGKLP
jgi:IS5 family transposase